MNNRQLLFIWITLSLLLHACAPQNTPSAPVATETQIVNIRLPMGYIPNVQFAPFYAAVEQGFYREAGIEIEFDYSFETDGVALVGSNDLQFALASGEQVLLARAQGIPVTYILGWYQQYPISVVAAHNSGIRTPADLRGQTIGLPGLFGANYIGLRALLRAGGVSESEVNLQPIGFNQVEAFSSGQVPVIVVYTNNEPIVLQSQGYQIVTLNVRDYVTLASNGLITNQTTLHNNPELARRMVQATQRGIRYTLAHPDEAFEICKKYVPNLTPENEPVQRSVLEASLKFWVADPIGKIDPKAWSNMQNVLLDMGLLTQPIDLNTAYTTQFLQP